MRDMRDALGALGPVAGQNPELNNLTLSMTQVCVNNFTLSMTQVRVNSFTTSVTQVRVNSFTTSMTQVRPRGAHLFRRIRCFSN